MAYAYLQKLLVFLQHSSVCSSLFATFRKWFWRRSSIQKKEQHSEERAAFRICFEEEQQWFWRKAALPIWRFSFSFVLQFLHFKFCIWRAAGYYLNWIYEQVFGFLLEISLSFHWKISENSEFFCCYMALCNFLKKNAGFLKWNFLSFWTVFLCC